MNGSPGEFAEHLPLESWRLLAWRRPARPAQVHKLLAEIRSDHGADSTFYQWLAASVARRDQFAVERAVLGEWSHENPAAGGEYAARVAFATDFDHYHAAMNKKWRAINRRCLVRRDLASAFARMLHDHDGLDWHNVWTRELRMVQSESEIGYMRSKARLYAKIAANHPEVLSTRKTPDPVYRSYDYARAVVDRIDADVQGGQHGALVTIETMEAYLRAGPHSKITRHFCGGEPFAAEAAQRGHEHPDLASDDDCWTGSLLARMADGAVQSDEQEETWTDSELVRVMQACETPPALRAPLREFLGMMRVVRDKYPTATQRQAQADELRDRFVAHFDVGSRPIKHVPQKRRPSEATPRALLSASLRLARLAARVATGASAETRAEYQKSTKPLRKLLAKLPAPVRAAIQRTRTWSMASDDSPSDYELGRIDALRDDLDAFIKTYYAQAAKKLAP
jgi:hypothetical protein